MTNREHEFLECGIEYAEGLERAKKITLPSGREIHRQTDVGTGATSWTVQPWNEFYWEFFNDLLDAVKCGTRPEVVRPIEYAGRPQRNPPDVEFRKPFKIQVVYDLTVKDDRWGVVCEGKALFPNTHGNTLLVTLFTETEAQKLAYALNEAFANHFDV